MYGLSPSEPDFECHMALRDLAMHPLNLISPLSLRNKSRLLTKLETSLGLSQSGKEW